MIMAPFRRLAEVNGRLLAICGRLSWTGAAGVPEPRLGSSPFPLMGSNGGELTPLTCGDAPNQSRMWAWMRGYSWRGAIGWIGRLGLEEWARCGRHMTRCLVEML